MRGGNHIRFALSPEGFFSSLLGREFTPSNYPLFRPRPEPVPSSCNPLRHTAYGLCIFWPGKIQAQAKAGSFGVPMVNLGFFFASGLWLPAERVWHSF